MEDEAAAVAAAIGIQQKEDKEQQQQPPTPLQQPRQSPLVNVQLVDDPPRNSGNDDTENIANTQAPDSEKVKQEKA
jgi:hypothetical protein